MNITNIVAIFTLIMALVFNLIQNIKISKQMKLQIFTEYTKRYQQILLNLPYNFFNNNYKNTSEINETTKNYIKIYIDLCSEEYYLFQSNNIETKVWKEWESGILTNLKLPHINNIIINDGINADFYKDFILFLHEKNILHQQTNIS